MDYSVIASSSHNDEGTIKSGENNIEFGVTKQSKLPSPADLLVSAFAACCLKNIERFSEFMHFTYTHADISVDANRLDKPPMINKITYSITVFSEDEQINVDLLHRNLQKFGTIYNTLNSVCDIEGSIRVEKVTN